MPRQIDYDALQARLLGQLRARGPARAAELRRALGVSQATCSRLLRRSAAEVLVFGRARATRYAARRRIPGVEAPIRVYRIDEQGRSHHAVVLHPTEPGFFAEPAEAAFTARLYDDLPFYLDELRPSGFLGRLVPMRHPELGLPTNVAHWSSDHCLAYLTRHGWNLPGNLIAGDLALETYLRSSDSPGEGIDPEFRAQEYGRRAQDTLAAAPPGSSAGGEQPKFLATLAPHGTAVLVKFSPPRTDPVGERSADLLVAEHVVHACLQAQGVQAARSELVEADGRLFLEVERFDRCPRGGRRGTLSLMALDAEFVGSRGTWEHSAEELGSQGQIEADHVARIRWLALFGQLIGNTDMHLGNLSFFMEGERPVRLTPVYDMLPMLYAPRQGHLTEERFQPPSPSVAHAPIWESALATAEAVWSGVAEHPLTSGSFRAIALENRTTLDAWRTLAERLPASHTRLRDVH